MASSTTLSLTPTQEWLLVQPVERTLTTHGIEMQVWTSSGFISKYEPLMKISSLIKKDHYWIYKSVITSHENKPKRYVITVRITPLKDDDQQNCTLSSEQVKQMKAIWDKIMHEKIYTYLVYPTNFMTVGESFETRIQSWTEEDEKDYGVKPMFIKVKEVRIERKAESSISPPNFLRKMPGKQIVRPLPTQVNSKKERKEPKQRQQSEQSCFLS